MMVNLLGQSIVISNRHQRELPLQRLSTIGQGLGLFVGRN